MAYAKERLLLLIGGNGALGLTLFQQMFSEKILVIKTGETRPEAAPSGFDPSMLPFALPVLGVALGYLALVTIGTAENRRTWSRVFEAMAIGCFLVFLGLTSFSAASRVSETYGGTFWGFDGYDSYMNDYQPYIREEPTPPAAPQE